MGKISQVIRHFILGSYEVNTDGEKVNAPSVKGKKMTVLSLFEEPRFSQQMGCMRRLVDLD